MPRSSNMIYFMTCKQYFLGTIFNARSEGSISPRTRATQKTSQNC
ncbi:unnamed protein product [Nezara viridula]|uniref:Uncharacterized protein n=1 Tax=Nezara viridula TaxID=85310 RepID=A0A9P0HAP1_NEZVI|nr:unnamed protein product [Nezara viridula]